MGPLALTWYVPSTHTSLLHAAAATLSRVPLLLWIPFMHPLPPSSSHPKSRHTCTMPPSPLTHLPPSSSSYLPPICLQAAWSLQLPVSFLFFFKVLTTDSQPVQSQESQARSRIMTQELDNQMVVSNKDLKAQELIKYVCNPLTAVTHALPFVLLEAL